METNSVATIRPEARVSGTFPEDRPAGRGTRTPATAVDFQALLLALLGSGFAGIVHQVPESTEGTSGEGVTAPVSFVEESSTVGSPEPPGTGELAGGVMDRATETKGPEPVPAKEAASVAGSPEAASFRVPRGRASPGDGPGAKGPSSPPAVVPAGHLSARRAERGIVGPGSLHQEGPEVRPSGEVFVAAGSPATEDGPGVRRAETGFRVRILERAAAEPAYGVSQGKTAGDLGGLSSEDLEASGQKGVVPLPGEMREDARGRFPAAVKASPGPADDSPTGERRGPEDAGEVTETRREKDEPSPGLFRLERGDLVTSVPQARKHDVPRAGGAEGTERMPAVRAHVPEKGESKAVEMEIAQPELGKVTVLLTARGGDVHVRFVSPDGGVREALWEGRHELFQAMSGKGLNLTGFLVDSGWNPAGGSDSPGEGAPRFRSGRRPELSGVEIAEPAMRAEKRGLVDYVV